MFSLTRAFQNGVTCSIWISNGKYMDDSMWEFPYLDTGLRAAKSAISLLWNFLIIEGLLGYVFPL